MAGKSILCSPLYFAFSLDSTSVPHPEILATKHKALLISQKILPVLKFEGQTQFKAPFFYVFYSSWGIKFGQSAPVRAVNSHSQPQTPRSEQAAVPREQTHLISSSRHWRLGTWEVKDEATDTSCSNSDITAWIIFKAWNPWQSQDGKTSFHLIINK